MASPNRERTTSVSQGVLRFEAPQSARGARLHRPSTNLSHRSSLNLRRSYSIHIDDSSVYYDREHDIEDWEDWEDDEQEIPGEEENKGLDQVRDSDRNEKDLEEPPLQRKSTARSRKDPNLVRSPLLRCTSPNWRRSHGMVQVIHRTQRIGR